MSYSIFKNKTEAKKNALQAMRYALNRKRLGYHTIENVSAHCGCGEIQGIEVCSQNSSGKWIFTKAGYCKNCGTHNG